MNKFVKEGDQSNVFEVQAFVQYYYGKYLFLNKDLYKAIDYLKCAKDIAGHIENYFMKLKCFKQLGKTFSKLKLFKISRFYFTK